MTVLDWIVIALYLGGIVAFAWRVGRAQRDVQGYYLANRNVRWWQSGLSTMATQLSAISFVSAPAFVAIKTGGGLKWLCYEFGVPLGLLAVMFIIIPRLHRHKVISIYEYLEHRFDRTTRVLVSFLFQLGRGLATAVAILAGGLILSTALGISTAHAIIVVGAVTILYDVLGGIRVVILSDILQMAIIIVGLAVCSSVALTLVDWNVAWQALSGDRLAILDFKHWGVDAEGTYAFWPMLFGGIFLYASYYGCDQSQVQRELTVGSVRDVRRSLLVNVFGRFPIVLLYCTMGVLVGAVMLSPELAATAAAKLGMGPSALAATLQQAPDRMVPMFVLAFLPAGLVGLIFVAIMSALMSSLDSAINSLSASTMQDFYRPFIRPRATERQYLIASKITTLCWGVFCVAAALVFLGVGESTRQTTLVLINAVGSLIYGPILAAFLLGMLVHRVHARAMTVGIVAGLVANIAIWQLTTLSWLWWNVTGFGVTVTSALVFSLVHSPIVRPADAPDSDEAGAELPSNWLLMTAAITLYLIAIIAVCYFIQR
jgi:SSS family solute:Na+ symporter